MILWHELGHALAARWFVDGDVSVQVGRGDRWLFRVTDIDFRIGMPSPIGTGGVCHYPATVTASESLVIVLAGPLATLLGAGIGAHALAVAERATARRRSRGSDRPGQRLRPQPPPAHDHGPEWPPLQDGRTPSARCSESQGRTASTGRCADGCSPAQVATAPELAALPFSPSCVRCGHRRDEHVDLATGQPGGCLGQDHDFQSLSARVCRCAAFVATSAQ